MQQKTGEVFCKDELLDYIVKLIEATRGNQWVFQGISPRGSLALLKMARAHAFMEDRDYVVPEDIHEVFYSVANHRMQLSTAAKAAGKTAFDVTEQVLSQIPIPRI